MRKRLKEQIKTVAALRPVSQAAGTVNGLVIDRKDFEDAMLAVSAGAASGSPSALTVNVKIQTGDAADGSGMADVAGVAITEITAVNTERNLAVDLLPLKRYVRAVATVGFTGGSSPEILLAAMLTLGNAKVEPVE